MIKKLSILIPALIILLSPSKALAAENIIVTCEKTDVCDANHSGPLFDLKTFLPGETYQRTIEIINNRDDACDLNLDIDEKNNSGVNLDDQLFVEISSGDRFFYGETEKTFADLFATGGVDLGHVDDNESKVILWQATFNPDAGNEYQGVSTKFDFDFEIECDDSGTGGSGDGEEDGDSEGSSSTNDGSGGQVAGLSTFFGFTNQGSVAGEVVDLDSTSSGQTDGSSDQGGAGDIQGATTCSDIVRFFPFILLALQVLLQLFNENYFRRKPGVRKLLFWLGIGLLSLVIYHYLKKPDCYLSNFWKISLGASLLIRLFGDFLSRKK